MWSAEHQTACLLNDKVIALPKVMTRKKLQVTEWSLVAKVNMPPATFIGFYSGEFSTDRRESLYSAQVDQMHIYPFADEENITLQERIARPLASMNEPAHNTDANCCMIVQDFAPNEVAHSSPNVRFYRGLACFTCAHVYADEEITWNYGASYEANRQMQGYEAGPPCKLLRQQIPFLPDESRGVLDQMPIVSLQCVFPVTSSHKSARFPLVKKPKRRRRSDSSEEDSDASSSGSGHAPKYVPSLKSREERVNERSRHKKLKTHVTSVCLHDSDGATISYFSY